MTLMKVSDNGKYVEPSTTESKQQHQQYRVNETYSDVSIDELRPEARSKHPDHWSNNIGSENFDPRQLADTDTADDTPSANLSEGTEAIDPRELFVADDDSDSSELRFDKAWDTGESAPSEMRNFDPRELAAEE